MGGIMDDWFGIDSSEPSAPAAPDPVATAAAQYQYNSQAAKDAAKLNAVDQFGPYGSTQFARREDGTPYAQTVTLSPQVQAMLDAQFGAGTALNAAAQKQLGYLPQDKFQLPAAPDARQYATDAFGEKTLDFNNFADPLAGGLYKSTQQQYNSPAQAVSAGQTRQIGAQTNQQQYNSPAQAQQYHDAANAQSYNGQVTPQQYQSQGYDSQFAAQNLAPTNSTNNIAQTSYDQAKSLFEPDLQAARKQIEIQLANRGISPGDEIWNDQMGRLDRQENQAYSGASRQAILDSGAEQSRQFGQNLQAGQFSASENQRGMSDAQFAAQFGMSDAQFKAQFGSGEDARNLANQQFGAQFGASEDARRLANSQFGAQFGSGENQRLTSDAQFGSQFGSAEDQRNYANAQSGAQYYDQSDLARRGLTASENQRLTSDAQFGAGFNQGEDARLAGADLSNRQFLGATQNQQFNQANAALGYGNNAYQQNLANQLLERNQPFAEAAALLGTTPSFQTPSFMNTAPQSVAPPNYEGVVNNNYSTQAGMYNAAQTRAQSQSNGVLGALGQVGAAVAPIIFSDEDLKEDRRTADGENILAMFREMPVDDYRYKDEARGAFDLPEHRTGTMAQDYAEHFGGDGHTIDLGDAVGKLMAAMKALDKRTAGMSSQRHPAAHRRNDERRAA